MKYVSMNSKLPFQLCGANNLQNHAIIFNKNIPSCRNCKFYNPNWYNKDFTSSLNKCMKFGSKNIITNEITYEYADSCRKQEDKCGLVGKYFIQEENIENKIWMHALVSNTYYSIPWIMLFLAISFNAITVYQSIH